jgi:hypothetical protein
MQPTDGTVPHDNQWALASDDDNYLIDVGHDADDIEPHLPDIVKQFQVRWVDPQTGTLTPGGEITAAGTARLSRRSRILWLTPKR